MAKYVDCPFCGNRGIRTDEHVWAQWLHETPAAKQLLANSHGERIANRQGVTRKGPDGRYFSQVEVSAAYAKWLPNVKVDVCSTCNSQWMSQLESQAKSLLGPFIFDGAFSQLTAANQVTLATWVTKSWMAYGLTRPDQRNPFAIADYRTFTSSPAPMDRSNIWMFHSVHPMAYVSMGIESSLISFGPPPDMEAGRDTVAICVLAASSVVFVMFLRPEEMPPEGVDLMVPGWLANGPATQIWPSPRPTYLATARLPDEAFDQLLGFPEEMFAGIGLPISGLNDEEVGRVLKEFLAGADVADLRAKWGQG